MQEENIHINNDLDMSKNNAKEKTDTSLLQRWQHIIEQITQAQQQKSVVNGLSETNTNIGLNANAVTLVAVSKTKPVQMIQNLYKAGQRDFGENYLQEALAKIVTLKEQSEYAQVIWHYIGHIQRNKTRDIAENFDWVHTLERDIIAKRLHDQRPEELPALNVLIQVNIDREESKSGCLPEAVEDLVTTIKMYSNLCLRGLMIIPAKANTDAFAQTQALFLRIKTKHPELTHWDTLSMGMSDDMVEAIQQGATMVRVGSAIFGSRE